MTDTKPGAASATNDRKGVYSMTTLTFDQWMSQCDGWIYNECSIHAEYLPDWDYRAAYDDGMKPREAAESAIDAAKWH